MMRVQPRHRPGSVLPDLSLDQVLELAVAGGVCLLVLNRPGSEVVHAVLAAGVAALGIVLAIGRWPPGGERVPLWLARLVAFATRPTMRRGWRAQRLYPLDAMRGAVLVIGGRSVCIWKVEGACRGLSSPAFAGPEQESPHRWLGAMQRPVQVIYHTRWARPEDLPPVWRACPFGMEGILRAYQGHWAKMIGSRCVLMPQILLVIEPAQDVPALVAAVVRHTGCQLSPLEGDDLTGWLASELGGSTPALSLREAVAWKVGLWHG